MKFRHLANLSSSPAIAIAISSSPYCGIFKPCKNIMKANILLGQGSSLQALLSSLSPGHDSPPKDGGGLVQVLDLFWTPPPHVTGQSLQSFHSDQLPSTAKRILNEIEFQRKGQNYRPPENHSIFITNNCTQTRNFIKCSSSAQSLQDMAIHSMLRRSNS